MTLALAFLLLLLTVPLFGGKLSRVGEVRIRWIGLAAAAFAIQVVLVTVVPDGDSTVHRILHLATYALAAMCLIRNLDLRFVWLVGVGGLLNLIAIASNGGVMPASRSALDTAGLDVKSGEFANSDYVEDAHVSFMGDVFAIPDGWPGANVFSVGDVLMLLGVILAIHAVAGSRLTGTGRTGLRRSQGSPAAR
jgi:uncharacterized protein DUF5317